MSRRRVVALFRAGDLGDPPRSPVARLLFIAPIVITGLVTFILRESQAPQVTAAVVNLAGPRGQASATPRGRAPHRGATVTDVADEGAVRASIADTSVSVGIVLRAGAATGSALDITVITNGLDPSGDAGPGLRCPAVGPGRRHVRLRDGLPVIDHTTIYGTRPTTR